MGMNRDLIGKVYPDVTWAVTAEQTTKYASAYNDDNPAFHDASRPGGIVAPPLFNVVPPAQVLAAVFFDEDLHVNFGRLLHGEQDMRFMNPIRPGDTITTTGRIADIVEKSSGEILLVQLDAKNQRGDPVARQILSFFVRASKKEMEARGAGEAKEPKAAPPDRGEPDIVGTSRVTADQTDRYAPASMDHNPIHLDNDFARSVGLPSRINHGLSTMAMASKVIIDKCLGGDPLKLARIKLRFKAPVTLDQTITTRIWKTGAREIAFETLDQAGNPVLVEGVAEFAG
jgi:acyl dehydratase